MSILDSKKSLPDQGILLYPTFSAVFFPLLFIYLLIYSPLVYFFNLILSEYQFTSEFQLLIDILILIIGLPLLYGMIPPYQKIEFTKKALIMSFSHKALFLLTSPFLLLSILIVEDLKKINPFFSSLGMSLIYDLISISIVLVVWCILTELIWDFITNLFNIQTSKRKREVNLKANKILGVNKNLINYITTSEQYKRTIEAAVSNRWQLIVVEIPFLIFMLSFLFINLSENSIFSILILTFTFALFFLFLLPDYRMFLIKHKISLNKFAQINRTLFGPTDISDSVRNDSIFLMFSLGFLIPVAYIHIESKTYFPVILVFLYFLMLINFIVSAWSTKILPRKEPYLDLKTKSIRDQIQNLIKMASTGDSIFQLDNSTNFYFTDTALIQKILPYPFDTYNWIIFNFKDPLFNPFVIKELASVLDMDIKLNDFFRSDLLTVFSDLDLKPWEQYSPEIRIYNKIIQLYNFKASDFQEKSQNRIFFFNFKNTFLLCNHSINPLIADKFMFYYDNFLKKKLFSSKIVDSISFDSRSNLEIESHNDLIYWNVTDQFLSKVMINKNNFLLDQKTLRKNL